MRRVVRDVTWLVVAALALTAVGAVVVVVSVASAWRFVLAPLLGIGIWLWASTTLRSMVRDGRSGPASGPAPAASDEPTVYWCEDCGTELVMVVRGSGTSPRHCGTRMHARTEVVRQR